MKKKLMPLAVGAIVAASSAQAQMYLNNDGTGEMLVFPFYSAEIPEMSFYVIGKYDHMNREYHAVHFQK